MTMLTITILTDPSPSKINSPQMPPFLPETLPRSLLALPPLALALSPPPQFSVMPISHHYGKKSTPSHFIHWTWRIWPRSTQLTPPLHPKIPTPLLTTIPPDPLDWQSQTPHIHYEIAISPPDPSAPKHPQTRQKDKYW